MKDMTDAKDDDTSFSTDVEHNDHDLDEEYSILLKENESNLQKPMKNYKIDSWKFACLFSVIVYLITFFGILPLIFQDSQKVSSDDNYSKGYIPSKVLFGHVHMAKTVGTSLNGLLANRFERVCGHKGWSYDAFQSNERAKEKVNNGEIISLKGGDWNRDRVHQSEMDEIGYEDCDYISDEIDANWWIKKFGDAKFHNTTIELHIPCRDPIDHLMSQCNFRHRKIDCKAESDEDFYESIEECFVFLNRYSDSLTKHFDVKCFDFQQQFTTYIDTMATKLEERRFISKPYIKRETNRERKKNKECIWKHPHLMEKARTYLLENVAYYHFCDECMGGGNDLTRDNDLTE